MRNIWALCTIQYLVSTIDRAVQAGLVLFGEQDQGTQLLSKGKEISTRSYEHNPNSGMRLKVEEKCKNCVFVNSTTMVKQ